MKFDRRQLIDKIVETARELPPERQTPFVVAACRQDDDLTREVSRMMLNS